MNNGDPKLEVVAVEEFIPVLLDGPLAMFGGDFPQVGDIFALQAYSVEPSPNGWSVKLRPVKLAKAAIAKGKMVDEAIAAIAKGKPTPPPGRNL